MKKSSFAIILAAVVALCVPAVAFAALTPSPLGSATSGPAVATAPTVEQPAPSVEAAPQAEVPAQPEQEAAPTPAPEAAAPTRSDNGRNAVPQGGYHHPEAHHGTCAGYADADGDGICDNCNANGIGCPNFVDEDGDGVCDAYRNGSCAGFADANGDGVCDNCAGAGANCPGFADADGDGICDNYSNNSCPGRGQSQGRHHGGGHGCMR